MTAEKNTTFAEKSAFTNLFVAYWRTFTDIPWAKDIYRILKAMNSDVLTRDIQNIPNNGIMPYFEARYLLSEVIIKEMMSQGVTQILELGSGMSPRGLYYGLKGVTFVEIDLEEEILTKKRLIEKLCTEQGMDVPPNLFLVKGNVADAKAFWDACAHFDLTKPVVVICEGLLRYLSFDDKDILTTNVHDLLATTGGCWFTPDIELLDENPNGNKSHETMKQWTGIDTRDNLFKDMDHAEKYFMYRRFRQPNHYPPAMMMDRLVSPKRLDITDEEVQERLAHRHAFLLEAAK